MNRWGQRKPTPTIVADLGALLFQQRIADAEAAARDEAHPITIFRVATAIEALRQRRRSSVADASFSGNKRLQVDLAQKLERLPSYNAKDGRLLRVVGPEHRVGTEVHLYLDVVEAVEDSAIRTPTTVAASSPSSQTDAAVAAAVRQQLSGSELRQLDSAVKTGAPLRVEFGRIRKKRMIILIFLMTVGAATLAQWIARTYAPAPREESAQPASTTVEVTPALRLDELRKVRVTPAMFYGLNQSSRHEVCTSNGVLAPSIRWQYKESVAPPFVLLRNNEVYEDHITTRDKHFTDYAAIPGQTYQYALGKRNPVTGDIDIGSAYASTAGTCSKPNRAPVVGIFPDPPGGTAPIAITFFLAYADDAPGDGVTFQWMFGDGEMLTSDARKVTHEYKYGGDYQVSVGVRDGDGGGDSAGLILSLAGPPAPPPSPEEPEQSWVGQEWVYASKVRGRVEEEFFLRATPQPIQSGAKPIAYRWVFGDCLEDAMPGSSRFEELGNRNCISDPLTVPDIRRRFARPGLFAVMLEITYDSGETMHRHLGSLTVRPNEAYYAKHPEDRAYYNEPAPTPPDWDRRATPVGRYQ